jgi:uncharacterized protein YjbI with pentapeptide repeats
MDRKALESALKAHERFLQQLPKGKRASLLRCDLTNADLEDRNLAEADLTGATLRGANLKFANFERAHLYCADLGDVDGRHANFTRADMRGAVLKNSNFSFAKLDHADFRAARLAQTSALGKFEIIDRNTAADCVDFSYCSLRGASFDRANLKGANFTGAFLHGTTFRGARGSDVCFEKAVLIDVDLSDLQVPAASLQSCIRSPAPAALAKVPHLLVRLEAHQRWIASEAHSGSSAVLDGEDLRPLETGIGKFQLTAISARNAVAVGMNLSGAQLQGADFAGADLRDVNFEGADLRGINFRDANLAHARFESADLTSLRLKSGGTRSCDFTGARFTQKQLANALLETDALAG